MTEQKDHINTSAGTISRRPMIALSAALGIGTFTIPALAHARSVQGVEDTLDRIRRTGVLNLGAREATPPYGFKNAAGHYVGFATEIAEAIAVNVGKALGKPIKLNYIPVTSRTRIPLLQNGTIDMEAGATVVTQARAKVVDFTIGEFTTSTEVLVPSSSKIRSLSGLSGKRLGVSAGGDQRALYEALNAKGRLKPPVKVIGFPDHPQAFTALQTGAVDAISTDGPILYGMRGKAANPSKWAIFDPHVNAFVQAFPIRQESSKFRSIANITMAQMYADGSWSKLYEKYFGPKSQNPFPMTETLKALVVINSWPPR